MDGCAGLSFHRGQGGQFSRGTEKNFREQGMTLSSFLAPAFGPGAQAVQGRHDDGASLAGYTEELFDRLLAVRDEFEGGDGDRLVEGIFGEGEVQNVG